MNYKFIVILMEFQSSSYLETDSVFIEIVVRSVLIRVDLNGTNLRKVIFDRVSFWLMNFCFLIVSFNSNLLLLLTSISI